ncbi:MAG: class I SAM-dependent RNA methyltransferase [Oscillospiraceae bacterium]|nr:class I SAM-dependent RNA methyltransferase [Oscillospiraceae bacterium]
MYRLVATCGFGLESVLAYEIRHLGFEEVEVHDGRIFFDADEYGIARANIWLRTAERVLIVLDEYPAPDFDALYDGAFSTDWSSVLSSKDAFPVKGYSLNSRLTSIPACQSVLKKAIVEKMKAQYSTQFLPERGIEKKIRFSIVKDICTLMLDTSGDGLHKRGYRPLLNEAPIRETLAAGMTDFARVYDDSTVIDPFCGSGTIVIESAMRAMNMAPGLSRRFAAEEYDIVGREIFDEIRSEARSQIRNDVSFRGIGSDIDVSAVRIASENAERAGVGHLCSFSVADARELDPPAGSLIITNPPYGERLSSPEEAEKLCTDFGKRVINGDQRGAYVISSLPDFEKHFGKQASRRRKLYNGMIPCQLFMYFSEKKRQD